LAALAGGDGAADAGIYIRESLLLRRAVFRLEELDLEEPEEEELDFAELDFAELDLEELDLEEPEEEELEEPGEDLLAAFTLLLL